MAQGKKWNKAEIVEALKPYLLLGYSIKRACLLAGIEDSTIYKWLKKDPNLSAKFKAWQLYINAEARNTVAKAIKGYEYIEEGRGKRKKKIKVPPDPNIALKWLERREREEFSLRYEYDHTSGGRPIKYNVEIINPLETKKEEKKKETKKKAKKVAPKKKVTKKKNGAKNNKNKSD